jgi:hypothetical protein
MTNKELYSDLYREREKKKTLLNEIEKLDKNPANTDLAKTIRAKITELDLKLSEIDEKLTQEEKREKRKQGNSYIE